MSDKIGKLNSNLVWLFALTTVIVAMVGGYLTQSLGTKISAGVFFGVFIGGGFIATLLTQASKGKAIGAFSVASILTAIGYFVVIKMVVSGATAAASAGASGASAAAASAAAGAVGSVMGIFVAVMILVATLVAGITGVLAGSKGRSALAS